MHSSPLPTSGTALSKPTVPEVSRAFGAVFFFFQSHSLQQLNCLVDLFLIIFEQQQFMTDINH